MNETQLAVYRLSHLALAGLSLGRLFRRVVSSPPRAHRQDRGRAIRRWRPRNKIAIDEP